MNDREKQLRKYCRQVTHCLPMGSRFRKQLSVQLIDRIHVFLEEQPQADMAQIVQHFGTPTQIAEAYVQEIDPSILLKKLHNGNRIIQTVAVALLIALTLWGSSLLVTYIEQGDAQIDTCQSQFLEI